MVAAQESSRHRSLMRRAIREARRARGRTHPNPMVGCVIAKDGDVVATGYHSGPGEPHAEAAALENLDESPEGCDVYVNLEPCCHRGRTPPCSDTLIAADVGRVIVGAIDPNPKVSGEGVRQLREAGIDVVVGILEEESQRLNEAYFKYIEHGVPWVSVKYAMTLDGKIATRTGESAWITGDDARKRVHEMRDRYDAIMVGTGTLNSDNPRLTCRIDGGRDPIRVILDARLEAPLDSNVYRGADDDSQPDTLVVIGDDGDREPEVAERAEKLRERGLEILEVRQSDDGLLDLGELLEVLGDRGIVRLFVEGGGRLIGSLFDADRIDHVYAFVAPKLIGGQEAPGPNDGLGRESMVDARKLARTDVERLGDDLLISGDVQSTGDSDASMGEDV